MSQADRASDPSIFSPESSVFVSANAGAGKTSLLVNRVLSLLLHGTAPGRILCLTFTNAASAEMTARVQKELGKWLMATETDLEASLQALLGHRPTETQKSRARSLFAEVLESPDGVRIQTIHAFCQSLLRRFPIEANLNPHFTVIDDRTEKELLQESRLRLFTDARHSAPELQQSIFALAQGLGEQGFHGLLAEIIGQKQKFNSLFAIGGRIDAAMQMLEALANPSIASHAALIEQHFNYSEADASRLRAIIPLLLAGEATDRKTGEGLAAWLENAEREPYAERYLKIFLTREGEARKTLFTKKTLSSEADIAALRDEQQRVMHYYEARKALDIRFNTAHVLRIADALLAIYEAQKRDRGALDYDDLILAANRVLAGERVIPWVLFKLDGGIDHVLVDEAQDTSPEQWMVIRALTQEFFAGLGRSEEARSLFIVGDEKQSIYSFQGADVEALGHMQAYFRERIRDAGMAVYTVALAHSYRSTPEVLSAVDAIFSRPAAKAGLMFEEAPLIHIPTRSGQPGQVEVWPVFSKISEEDVLPALSRMTRHIAETIGEWLETGQALPSKQRAIQPGDIMILVRSRGSLVDRLVRALKRRNIPVAGIDRMLLGDNLAVQDLLALGQFLLLPEDDLTLAALLKSPIGNISEEALFGLAWERGTQSLWQRLGDMAADDAALQAAHALLTDLRARVDYVSPFELYSYVLDGCGIRKRIIGRMGEEYADPLDEFLNQALLFERSHAASMQGFLHWITASDSVIKRDMEQTKNAVRIMTIHGAKGLQAPIVILPDTTEPPMLRDSLLWHEEEGGHLPLWSKGKEYDDARCKKLRAQQRQRMQAEYRRLLYVALTRAEDRLFICGASQRKNINEESWYRLIYDGLTPIATPFMTPWGEGLRLGDSDHARYRPARDTKPEDNTPDENIFRFLQQPPPDEPLPARPLSPSKLSADNPPAASLLQRDRLYQRGNLIHALLQYLPAVAPEQRRAIAAHIAQGYATAMPPELCGQCIQETLHVLSHPEFSFLFDPGSMAEVPIVGTVEMDGKPHTVSGQIDRLVIHNDAVWVVDFKSNVAPPAPGQAIPRAYIEQMRLYSTLLRHIYPGRPIHAALLWTANASITRLDEALVST